MQRIPQAPVPPKSVFFLQGEKSKTMQYMVKNIMIDGSLRKYQRETNLRVMNLEKRVQALEEQMNRK